MKATYRTTWTPGRIRVFERYNSNENTYINSVRAGNVRRGRRLDAWTPELYARNGFQIPTSLDFTIIQPSEFMASSSTKRMRPTPASTGTKREGRPIIPEAAHVVPESAHPVRSDLVRVEGGRARAQRSKRPLDARKVVWGGGLRVLLAGRGAAQVIDLTKKCVSTAAPWARVCFRNVSHHWNASRTELFTAS